MCTTSGEYPHEKIIYDKTLIGYSYAPTTTYNNDGQSTKKKKKTRER